MKKLLLVVAVALTTLVATAQNPGVAINTSGAEAHASSLLDVSGTGKGVLIPRMTAAQRPISPVTGLLIYQTDNTPGFYYFNGSAWTALAGGSSSSSNSSSVSIIPLASGTALTMTTIAGGSPGIASGVAFGNNFSNIALYGNSQFDLTPAQNGQIMAFTVPVDGTITNLSAVFSSSVGLSLIGSTLTPKLEIYISSGLDNTFTKLPGAEASLSGYTGSIGVGSLVTGFASGLSIPVSAGTRLIAIMSATATGLSTISPISLLGYFSGSIGFKPGVFNN